LTVFQAVHEGKLDEISLEVDPSFAATIVATSGGYPEAYEKGKTIYGLEGQQDKMIFHAGTIQQGEEIKTSGGRVLAVTSFGIKHQEALKDCYETLSKISFEGINYRKDIGFDL
jgi:phosphoribosylamine--glycine ligase